MQTLKAFPERVVKIPLFHVNPPPVTVNEAGVFVRRECPVTMIVWPAATTCVVVRMIEFPAVESAFDPRLCTNATAT
jgi:hypothetical protein